MIITYLLPRPIYAGAAGPPQTGGVLNHPFRFPRAASAPYFQGGARGGFCHHCFGGPSWYFKSFSLFICLLLAGRMAMASSEINTPLAYPGDSLLQITRGEYTLVAYVGAGLSYYSTSIGIPPGLDQVTINRTGVPTTLRVMWHPDHRLRLGLETGWSTMYSYNAQASGKPVKVYVSTVPILIVWSMPIAKRFNVFAGTGAFIVNSHVDYAGKVNVDMFSLGWMVAGSYVQPISKRLGIAGEIKWLDAIETEDANLSFQIQLVWKFLRW